MCKTNQCYHNKLPLFPAIPLWPTSLSSPPRQRGAYAEEAHEYSAYKLSARRARSRVQRLTYTLVDHKWVCFTDCCRVVGAPRAEPGGSVEYASPRGTRLCLRAPRYGVRAYRFYNLHRADKPRIRLSVVPRHLIARASGTSKRCVTPRCVGHPSFGAMTNTRVSGVL